MAHRWSLLAMPSQDRRAKELARGSPDVALLPDTITQGVRMSTNEFGKPHTRNL